MKSTILKPSFCVLCYYCTLLMKQDGTCVSTRAWGSRIYMQGCLQITSYFWQDSSTVQRIWQTRCNFKVIKMHISSVMTNLHYFQVSNITKLGTCQRLLMLQGGLLLQDSHHIVKRETQRTKYKDISESQWMIKWLSCRARKINYIYYCVRNSAFKVKIIFYRRSLFSSLVECTHCRIFVLYFVIAFMTAGPFSGSCENS